VGRGREYALSLDVLPLSTARLYTLVQPGHSLFSLNWSNPFDPLFLAAPDGHAGGANQLAGGLITFGGGVPLYSGGKVIGGLGTSGDTSCTDHEIAKRVRSLAGLTRPGGSGVDDIVYPNVDGPSIFGHPLCRNAFRNGVFLGNETPATGY
jgi:Haem degrading protein HbpS-like